VTTARRVTMIYVRSQQLTYTNLHAVAQRFRTMCPMMLSLAHITPIHRGMARLLAWAPRWVQFLPTSVVSHSTQNKQPNALPQDD